MAGAVTENEHDDLQKILEMVRRGDDFLFQPHIQGKPTRAEQLDELLSAVRAGKIGTRITLWIAGVIAAFGAIWSNWVGFFK